MTYVPTFDQKAQNQVIKAKTEDFPVKSRHGMKEIQPGRKCYHGLTTWRPNG